MNAVEKPSGLGKYLIVYLCMLVIPALEAVIAYQNIGGSQKLLAMLSLAVIGALLGILFFMNLATERRSFVLFIAVFTLFVLATINYGWTDSFRLLVGAPFAK
jgi:heme/copper-type cytochrome/quinol oxidase subunit 4